jgi:hypothetical protein
MEFLGLIQDFVLVNKVMDSDKYMHIPFYLILYYSFITSQLLRFHLPGFLLGGMCARKILWKIWNLIMLQTEQGDED